jgi:hypothetical protein
VPPGSIQYFAGCLAGASGGRSRAHVVAFENRARVIDEGFARAAKDEREEQEDDDDLVFPLPVTCSPLPACGTTAEGVQELRAGPWGGAGTVFCLADATFSSLTTGGSGGGASVSFGTGWLTLTRRTFSGCQSTERGGGMHVLLVFGLRIFDTCFTGCRAIGPSLGDGGGLAFGDSTTATPVSGANIFIDDTYLTKCWVNREGGGINFRFDVISRNAR